MIPSESTDASLCDECEAPLEPDGVCLACVFDSALIKGDSEKGTEEEGERTFSDFAPQAAGSFGKYLLKKELGAGGMGVIWEAKDTTLQRTVAIKLIRGFAFSSASERQRFQREATAIAQLEHSNIVPIYEVGEVEGQPYFTMKRLSGGTLSTRLAAGSLDQREAARIMEKLARAIAHAHERGVLHRDLKPDNVLFDKAGEPHLNDFGLAKLIDESDGLTLTTAQVGTPHYMSPEQARGLPNEISEASDIWGAGALFYHMLSGRVPFPGASSGEVFDRVAHQNPTPLRGAAGKIDPPLEILCLRCMEKDPKDRLACANTLADELQRWLAGEAILTKGVGRVASTLRWLRRHPWRVAAVVLGCLLLAVGYLASPLAHREMNEPSAAPGKASKAAYIPRQFVMETFSIDGDRQGPRFYVGWLGEFHGIIPDYMVKNPRKGSYIFHLGREDLDGGIALKVLNYHLAEEGRQYYLPNLTNEPVVYQAIDPLWREGDGAADEDLEFLSFQHQDRFLRHSGRMLFHHALYNGDSEKSRRIFLQDATWTVHQWR